MKDWKIKLRETDWFYTLESEDGMDSAVGLDFEYLEWFIEQLLSQAVQEAKEEQFTKEELVNIYDHIITSVSMIYATDRDKKLLKKVKSKLNK